MKTVIIAIVLTTFCASIERAYTQSNKCGLEKFQCKNGECIASELLCDGRPDCLDQSDETVAECSKPEILCPDYAFRCTYGGCVDGDATCNGIKDCIDNSDETLPRCKKVNGNGNTTECSSNQFKCDNGQCIDDTALCDGNVDCADSSDETYTKCGSFNCPQLVFRCAYGACIDGDLKCNGVVNCADASDEDPKLCGTVVTQTTVVTPSIGPIPVTHPTTPPTWMPKPTRPCTVPAQPQNGHWKLHSSQCLSGQDCDLEQGVKLDPGAHLVYTCNRGYKLRGSADVVCGPEEKWFNIPVCVEVRCKPLSTVSTRADCSYNGKWTSCESPVLPHTVATLSCNNGYQNIIDETITGQKLEVRCTESGEWNRRPIQCVAVCGVTAPDLTPTIVNGTRPKLQEFPWHATLYRVDKADGPKKFICGATIIREKYLLTAAHCVYSDGLRRVHPANIFYVATGNMFQDYDCECHDPQFVKKSRVKRIYVPCNYNGLQGGYQADIAILELETPFVFTSTLRPACLDSFNYGDEVMIGPNILGKVAGFGITAHGVTSAILQTTSVPYVSREECGQSGDLHDTERYITLDKFCAGYKNGTSVCDGDSGGGLVFQTRSAWFLRGIVSVGQGTRVKDGISVCDSYTYTLYTRIANHIDWIRNVLDKIEGPCIH